MRSNTAILSPEETAVAKAREVDVKTRIQHLEYLLFREKKQLKDLNVALAPHKRVPREILAMVFRYTIGGSPMLDPLPRIISCAPWSIRRVCSLWREVILSQHTIWNNLVFDVHGDRLKSKGKSVEAHFEFWRQNINDPEHPLSLTIPNSPNFLNTEATAAFIQENIIQANSGRLQELYLESDIFGVDFIATQTISFPILHTLRLPIESLRNLPKPLLSLRMPSLRKCILDIATVIDGISQLHLPWAQLTSLSIAGIGWPSEGGTMRCVLDIFRSCLNLQRLTLQLTISDENIDVPPDPIQHTRLRFLKLLNVHSGRESTLTPLDFLVAPSLSCLDL